MLESLLAAAAIKGGRGRRRAQGRANAGAARAAQPAASAGRGRYGANEGARVANIAGGRQGVPGRRECARRARLPAQRLPMADADAPPPPSHRACAGVVTEFVRCVRATPCVRAEGKSVTDCAAAPECVALRGRLLECRRRAVDARSRIQGNKLDT